MKKPLYSLVLLPLVLAVAPGNVLESKAEDVFSGVTFDYSKTDHTAFIEGKDLITMLAGSNVSQAEKDYVQKNYRVKYDLVEGQPFNYGNVNDEFYVESLDQENFVGKEYRNGSFTVPFEPYKYQNIAKTNSDELNGLTFSDGEVVFDHTITLARSAANEILNAAYKVGIEEKNKDDKFNAYQTRVTNFENYETNLAKYNEYEAAHNKWKAENKNYEQYLAEKAEYLEKKALYDQYVSDLEKYETDLTNYKKYTEALAAYNANKDLIEAAKVKYAAEIAQVEFQLSTLDCIYTVFPAVEAGGTVYSYIYRGAVDQVLSRQQDLSALGVPSTAIAKAGDATVKIRALTTEYNALRTASNANTDAGKVERYNFLIKNFTRLRSNLITLTQCLEKFYQNAAVRAVIESQGKTQRYIFLVAELIYCSELLSNTPVYSYDWTYARTNQYVLDHDYQIDGKAVKDILGVTVPETRPYKMTMLSSYPVSVEASLGKKPDPVEDYGLSGEEQPVKPTEVIEPVEPTLVAQAGTEPLPGDFGAPATRPVQPALPGVAPEQRNTDNDALFNLVKSNTLKLRDEFVSDKELHIEQSFDLSDKPESKIAVLCLLRNNISEVYEVIFVDTNTTSIDPKHEVQPVKNDEGRYEIIKEWKTPDGRTISLDDLLNSSEKINAVFEDAGEIVKYDIEWVEGSNVLATTESFDSFKPIFYLDSNKKEVTPTKEATSTTRYEFAGFDYKDLDGNVQTINKGQSLPITSQMKDEGNKKIVITVKFNEIHNSTATFKANGQTLYEIKNIDDGTSVKYAGATPTKESTNTSRYEFDYWTVNGVKVNLPYEVTEDVVFEAHFVEIPKYNIKFVYGDNVTESYYLEEGEAIVAPTQVNTKSFTDNTYFVFKEWDHELTTASKNDTYKAVYEEKSIIENATITRVNGVLNVLVKSGVNEINLAQFNKLLSEGYDAAPMIIKFGNIVISLSEANVLELANKGVTKLGVSSTTISGETTFKVVTQTLSGTNVDFTFDATINGLEDTANIKITNNQLANSTKVVNTNSMSFKVPTNTEIKFGVYFKVSFYEMSPCSYKVNDEDANIHGYKEFKKGERVVIKASGGNIDIKGLVALATNNEVIQRSDTDELIINSISNDLVIYSNTRNKQFTVTFKAGDDVIASTEVAAGLTIALPTATKVPDEYGTYLFKGWVNHIGENSLTVTGDVELVAQFELVPYPTKDEIAQASISYTMLAGQVLLAVVLLGYGIGFVVAIAKKDKKNKENKEAK